MLAIKDQMTRKEVSESRFCKTHFTLSLTADLCKATSNTTLLSYEIQNDF